MQTITTIGFDIAKSVFQVHGVDATGTGDGFDQPIEGTMRAQSVEEFDRPPQGWFALDIMKAKGGRAWDWVALMIDVDPEELKHCACNFPALFYVHPEEYNPAEGRVARQCYVRVPGKHRSADAAWEAFQDFMVSSLN